MIRPPEQMAIPFEDMTLPGYFCAVDETRRPLIISVGGYDSTAEESFFWNGAAALARGYHALIFDGPGQGELLIERSIHFRPDWEKVISAVIDLAVSRDDVDVSKIVLIGESWGGYLAPRAAAYDRRVALCVLDPAQIGLFRVMLSRLPLPVGLKRQLPHGPRWLVMLLRALMARMARQPTAGWALRRGMLTHGMATAWDYFVDATRYEQETSSEISPARRWCAMPRTTIFPRSARRSLTSCAARRTICALPLMKEPASTASAGIVLYFTSGCLTGWMCMSLNSGLSPPNAMGPHPDIRHRISLPQPAINRNSSVAIYYRLNARPIAESDRHCRLREPTAPGCREHRLERRCTSRRCLRRHRWMRSNSG